MKKLSTEEFKKYVDLLIVKKLDKDKKLESETDRYWTEINNHSYQFDRGFPLFIKLFSFFGIVHKEVGQLRVVTKDNLIQFFEKYLGNPETRRKISIRMFEPEMWAERRPNKEDVFEIKNIIDFRRNHCLWPVNN